MSNIFRLGSRRGFDQILFHQKVGILSLIRPVSLKSQPATPPKAVGHDERNMLLGRPQSPHLSIYHFELPALTSITHRATGMVLAGYTILFGIGAVTLPDSIPSYLESLQQADVNQVLIYSTKFMLAFPLTYHFWNGIRHLCWDMGKFLSMKEVYLTGYAMLAVATGSAIALTVM